MIEAILAKLAGLGLAAKVGVAAGTLAVSGSAAAASGALPDPAQQHVADAVEQVLGLDIPGGSRVDADHRADGDHGPAVENQGDPAPAAEFGQRTANRAKSGEPQDDGRSFGESVSGEVRQGSAPAGVPSAGDTRGEHVPETTPPAPPAPAEIPSVQDNPGTDQPAEAPVPAAEARPTADSNPGTAQRP